MEKLVEVERRLRDADSGIVRKDDLTEAMPKRSDTLAEEVIGLLLLR
jgi:hypothetical protein